MTPFASVAMLEKLALLKMALCNAPALSSASSARLRGHVFHREDQQLAVAARLELAGVEQHHPAADHRERVFQLKIIEDGTLGDDVFEQAPQVGDVPLAVAQLVNEAVLGFFGRDVKGLIESAIGGLHAQSGVEDQQRLAHRVDDVHRIVLNIFDERLGFHPKQPLVGFSNCYSTGLRHRRLKLPSEIGLCCVKLGWRLADQPF